MSNRNLLLVFAAFMTVDLLPDGLNPSETQAILVYWQNKTVVYNLGYCRVAMVQLPPGGAMLQGGRPLMDRARLEDMAVMPGNR
jgi:hypothetical protein